MADKFVWGLDDIEIERAEPATEVSDEVQAIVDEITPESDSEAG